VPTRRADLAAKLAKFYGLQQRSFDLYMGMSTGGAVRASLAELDLSSERFPYEGCQWPAAAHALAELRPTESEVFVDFGSGKGKALIIAGRLPYQRAVGVEIDPALAETARRNIAQVRLRSRADVVDCETASVLDWTVPDNTSTVFMYNPFFGETFHSALHGIFDSYDRNPRKLHIVYQYPWEHNWLLSTGRVVVENVRSIRWPPRRHWWVDEDEKVIVTYHVTSPSESAVHPHCVAHARSADSEVMRRWSGPVESLSTNMAAHLKMRLRGGTH
jgi:SAM-dependent methyltransferase